MEEQKKARRVICPKFETCELKEKIAWHCEEHDENQDCEYGHHLAGNGIACPQCILIEEFKHTITVEEFATLVIEKIRIHCNNSDNISHFEVIGIIQEELSKVKGE